jgi:hypothetical protein
MDLAAWDHRERAASVIGDDELGRGLVDVGDRAAAASDDADTELAEREEQAIARQDRGVVDGKRAGIVRRPAQRDALGGRLRRWLAERRAIGAQGGVIGAHMDVELVNDGPVTVLLELPS